MNFEPQCDTALKFLDLRGIGASYLKMSRTDRLPLGAVRSQFTDRGASCWREYQENVSMVSTMRLSP